MSQLRFAALVLAAVATLAACGSSDDSEPSTASAFAAGETVAVGEAPLPSASDGGSLRDAMEVAAAAPGEAADAACAIDRQTLETAIEAYELLNGSLPASQQVLADAQLIRELSARFEVGTDGVVIAAPGSPCP